MQDITIAVCRAEKTSYRYCSDRQTCSAMIFPVSLSASAELSMGRTYSSLGPPFASHNMSVSLSIFQKPCPACASSVSVGVERCPCGHVFESSSNSQSPLEAALRDEELYEGYLAARAEQAKQAAIAATRMLMEMPGDASLVAAAELASEVATAIGADHAAQCAKISAMRRALPVIARPVVVQPVTQSVAPAVAPPAPRVETTIAEVQPVKPAQATPTSHAATSVWHTTTTAQKAAGVLVALKNAKAREAAARTRQAMAAEHPVTTTNAAPSNIPPNSFRQDQSSRAEKIMVARKAADAKDCPNCTASVPLNTNRCHCGFTFVTDNSDLPSLTLCTGDYTALRDSLKLNLR